MKIQENISDSDGERHFMVTTSQEDWMINMPNMVMGRVIEMIAEKITEKFIKDHEQEVIKRIDPQAVATLVVAESGNAIKDMLDKKLPDKIEHIVKTEVYQRGFLGGITRIK